MSLKKFIGGERLLASDLNSMVDQIEANISMVETTWSNLKTLRDTSKLIPGGTYRITDYTCTTVQKDTQSAGHVFDILVTADDVNVLNENAHAIQHSGDSYFANSDLSAWELKYCLDNDTNRFAWADSSSAGRGVVYYMKDEFNNECPYDFKNIQYQRYSIDTGATSATTVILTNASSEDRSLSIYNNVKGLTGVTSYKYNAYQYTLDTWVNDKGFDTSSDFENGYDLNKVYIGFGDVAHYSCGVDVLWPVAGTLKSIYTFSSDDTTKDLSMNGYTNSVYNNSMLSYVESNKQSLNTNIFFGTSNYGNVILNNCYYNTFGNNCSTNTFGNNCSTNTFGNNCTDNTFGNSCNSNTFGNYCCYNTFGNYCNSNTFGNNCYRNTFGNNCADNTFGNECYSNTFGNECYYNTFGNYLQNNTFGNNCNSNIFGNSCYRNTFGNSCYRNTFGNYCTDNTFGNSCFSNTFGNDYISECTFFDGVNSLNVSITTGNNKYLQYMQVLNGTSGTINSSLIDSGRAYTTTIGMNSSGTLTSKVLMDA